jgi:hypothetical protein
LLFVILGLIPAHLGRPHQTTRLGTVADSRHCDRSTLVQNPTAFGRVDETTRHAASDANAGACPALLQHHVSRRFFKRTSAYPDQFRGRLSFDN